MPEEGSEPLQSTVSRGCTSRRHRAAATAAPLRSGASRRSGTRAPGARRCCRRGRCSGRPSSRCRRPGRCRSAGRLHESIPEVASVPLQLIETGWVYQPSWSAGRAGSRPSTVGGVESYCTSKSGVAVLFPASSVQVPWTDGVRAVRARIGRRRARGDPGGGVGSVPVDRGPSGCTSRSLSGVRATVGARERPAESRRT